MSELQSSVAMEGLSVPEPGQLVEVRRRQFIVTDVLRSVLPDDPMRSDGAQHLVRLSSVEEDALGDELEVIWEIEPGARVHERLLLPEPDGFDEPTRLDAFLDAVRWGAIESADASTLQAPFRAGIAIEDYQLDPVVRALQMPRANLLIADDVGLGKTIEAGLVAQELMLRHRVRTILVVVPASLQIKWRDEMRDRFGLEFRIVDSAAMRELRRRRGIHVNPWTHFPRLITSVDFLKRERPLRLFRECLPAPGESVYPRRFDLLIVDEAHNVAPTGRTHYATDSLRTLAVRTIAPHFEHKLFLTATPHNGYRESFSALLELLDDQRFARDVQPDRRRLKTIMVRRLKTEIVNEDGSPRFPPRKLEAIEVDYGDAERAAYRALQRYATLRQEGAREDGQRVATEFVLKLLKKRMFSSPAAFETTLEAHQRTLRGIRDQDRRTTRAISASVLRRELERSEEEAEDDDEYEEAAREAAASATRLFDALGDEERDLLRELEAWARDASARPDAKARRLIAWLDDTVRPGGQWNDERVIVFTEYRATQKWLQQLLAAQGLAANERVMTLYGGMAEDDRERVKAAFQAHPRVSPVRILLATDTASEGIDLQNWCHRLIHYEIPWNPNRLEQRNGRIDRHGQKREPLVFHFVGSRWRAANADAPSSGDLDGDLEFLMHAALKVDTIREDLGKVGPVIADRVERAMLGRKVDLDTSRAERDAEPARRMLRFERNLRERIAQLRERLDQSRRDLRVDPDNMRAVVDVALELAGQPGLEPAELPGVWPDPTGRRRSSPVFRMPALRGSWARCAQGLEHPHTREVRPITFDHAVASDRDDVVLVHLSHPLVQMSQRLLRAEIWSSQGRRLLHRVTARLVPDDVLSAPAVLAHARLLITSGTDHRLHEEVIAAGGIIGSSGLDRFNVGRTRELLDAVTDEPVPTALRDELAGRWPSIRESAMRALEARMRERTSGLLGTLGRRAEREAADLRTILEELAHTIRAELDAEPPAQLDLFDGDERRQFERNRDALEARLRSIPEEIERETEQIRLRYADPTPRLFPVSLTFLVPVSMVPGGR